MPTPKPRRAASSAKAAPTLRVAEPKPRGKGKPFEQGNPYRWKPGQSGNPAGKRGPSLSDLLTEMLGQTMPVDEKQALMDLIESEATIGQIIAFAIGLRAAGGDLVAVGVIADRTEGAPDQTVRNMEVTSEDMARAREKALAFERKLLAGTPAEDLSDDELAAIVGAE